MKYKILLLLTFDLVHVPLVGKIVPCDCTIKVEPKWQDLEHNQQHTDLFGGKWILAGSIIFKKKSNETIHISKLLFRWRGDKIENLLGSLYKKNIDKKFLAIEEHHISDSYWNRKKQTLIFNFKKPVSLGARNEFYLVLTVPNQLEQIIKEGNFIVELSGLPMPLRSVIRQQSLSFAFSNINSYEKQLNVLS